MKIKMTPKILKNVLLQHFYDEETNTIKLGDLDISEYNLDLGDVVCKDVRRYPITTCTASEKTPYGGLVHDNLQEHSIPLSTTTSAANSIVDSTMEVGSISEFLGLLDMLDLDNTTDSILRKEISEK